MKCNNMCEDFAIKCTKGNVKTFTIKIKSKNTTSGFQADFSVRKDYKSRVLLSKTFDIIDGQLSIYLSSEETSALPLENNQACTKYIWGVEIFNPDGERYSLIPKSGEHAPYFLLFPSAVAGNNYD